MAPLHTELRILLLTGVKTQERDKSVAAVRKERKLVRCVLWSQLEFTGWPGRIAVARKAGSTTGKEEPAQGV